VTGGSRFADNVSLATLVGVALLLWMPRLSGPIDLRYDSGVYYILGTGLAEGRGYRLLSEPGEIQAIQYPPLLPAIIAVHQWALGSNDALLVGHALRLSFFVLFTGYGLGVYVMARNYLTPPYALLVAWTSLVFLLSFFLSDFLFAELPFAVTTVLFVVCSRANADRSSTALAGLFAIGAFLLRTVGFAVLVAWIAESAFRKRFKEMRLRAAVAFVPVLLWQAYTIGIQSGDEYAHPAYPYQRASYQFYNVSYLENYLLLDPDRPELGPASLDQLRRRILVNAGIVLSGLLGESASEPASSWRWIQLESNAQFGSEVIAPWWVTIIINLLSALVVIGMWCLSRRGERVIPLYLVAIIGLICLNPVNSQFNRYFTPLVPFLTLSLVVALAALNNLRCRTWRRACLLAGRTLAALVIAMTLGVQCFTLFKAYTSGLSAVTSYGSNGDIAVYQLFYYDSTWRAFEESMWWLRLESAADDVVITTSPHFVYLRTGLKAIMPPFEPDPAKAQALLDSVPARYVIVDKLEFLDISRRYAEPAIRAHPELWTLVYSAPDAAVRIYRRTGRPAS
jgi:hypothetical protein